MHSNAMSSEASGHTASNGLAEANGQGRGILPAGHPLLATRARSVAFGEADLVLVAGTPLDFRLGYGQFGGKSGQPPARVVHLADAASQLATHCDLAGAAYGELAAIFTGVAAAAGASSGRPAWAEDWLPRLQAACRQATAADAQLLQSDANPIHNAMDPSAKQPRMRNIGP